MEKLRKRVDELEFQTEELIVYAIIVDELVAMAKFNADFLSSAAGEPEVPPRLASHMKEASRAIRDGLKRVEEIKARKKG